MRLLNFTTKIYDRNSADDIFVKNMAESFFGLLGSDYVLFVAYCLDDEKKKEYVKNLGLFFRTSKIKILFFWMPYVYYFFYIPFLFIFRENFGKGVVCFSNEANILFALIFWKKILFLRYKIYSDWHMLFNNFKDALIADYSDGVIVTSDKLKRAILDIGNVQEEKVIVARGGVDLAGYKHRSKEEARDFLGLPDGKKIVGYIGLYKTMGMEKGIDMMIRSLPGLSDDVVMMFVGGRGGEIVEYKKQAEELGVLSQCIFVEMVDFERVVQYEQASDILTIPYPDKPHFRQYGFPMKVYEYMASQRPILYSRLELAEEVLADCAFDFEADNEIDFARQVDYIFDNIELSQQKSRMAFEKVGKYTWDKRAKKIIDFIKK